ncbi:hypothetical protein B0A50_07345 [Salinomyces thailandicus]|uniref:Uncharacterized protein n=1 Tax=Salinomyces thailandicus TaxID=706561 RepID=A0A4U0TMS7_9PEZI|nr:hypothetical protein B0A50_07345 [Salinomyces thailandica]
MLGLPLYVAEEGPNNSTALRVSSETAQRSKMPPGIQRRAFLHFPSASPRPHATYATTTRPARTTTTTTTAPPQPLPWKPLDPSQRLSRHPPSPETASDAPKPKKPQSFLARAFLLRDDDEVSKPAQLKSKSSPSPSRSASSSLDSRSSAELKPPGDSAEPSAQGLSRGEEASLRYVRSGYKDPRYRAASWRVLTIISVSPLVIYLSYELFQRQFRGKMQKVRPVVGSKKDGDADGDGDGTENRRGEEGERLLGGEREGGAGG